MLTLKTYKGEMDMTGLRPNLRKQASKADFCGLFRHCNTFIFYPIRKSTEIVLAELAKKEYDLVSP